MLINGGYRKLRRENVALRAQLEIGVREGIGLGLPGGPRKLPSRVNSYDEL